MHLFDFLHVDTLHTATLQDERLGMFNASGRGIEDNVTCHVPVLPICPSRSVRRRRAVIDAASKLCEKMWGADAAETKDWKAPGPPHVL